MSAPERLSEAEEGCLNCGSSDVEEVRGSYASGVTGPNGELEILAGSGWICLSCGAVEDKLGRALLAPQKAEETT